MPASDTYTFAFQQSPTLPTTLNCPQTGQNGTPVTIPAALTQLQRVHGGQRRRRPTTQPDAVSFTLDGAKLNLNAVTGNIYGATVPTNPTTAGYTDQGLISRTCATGTAAAGAGHGQLRHGRSLDALTGGTWHSVQLTVNNATNCVSTPAAAADRNPPAVAAVPADCVPASFRFAYTRAQGDIADAAAAAVGKKAAIVFVNDGVGRHVDDAEPGSTGHDAVGRRPSCRRRAPTWSTPSRRRTRTRSWSWTRGTRC